MSKKPISRRSFVAGATVAFAAVGTRILEPVSAAAPTPAQQATGTRVGEVTSDSAIVWTRLTSHPGRNADGIKFDKPKKGERVAVKDPVEKLEGACPGLAGRVRLRYGTGEDLSAATTTEWFDVAEASDFIHQFPINKLKPGTVYHYESETTGPGGRPVHAPFRGRFETAPAAETPSDLRFCVMTCQGYPDRGHADGHAIYPSMLALKPAFGVLTGDLSITTTTRPAP